MNYKMTTRRLEGRIVLKRSHGLQYSLGVITLIIGAAAFPAGILLFFAPAGAMYTALFFTGFGLLFLSAAFMLFFNIHLPEFLIFDNNQGMLHVMQGKKDGPGDARIPYGDLQDFRVREERSTRTRGFTVIMTKRDGALWTLCYTSFRKKAEALHKSLSTQVMLGARGTVPTPGDFETLQISRAPGQTEISWKFRKVFRSSLGLMVLISAMGMALVGAESWITSRIGYAIAMVFLIALAIIALYRTLYCIGKTRRIMVTPSELRYEEKGGPVPGRMFTLPIGDIAAIRFNFSVSQSDTALYLIRNEEKENLDKIMEQNIDGTDFVGAIRAMLKVKRIDLSDLSIGDKVALEYRIQELIRELSGKTGL